MAFDRYNAEGNLRYVLERIDNVHDTLDQDILQYRSRDTIVDEDDEYKTMRDIRFYALKAYRELDSVLTYLDRYR